MKIGGQNFSAYLDSKGNIQKIVFQDKLFEPPMKYTLYEINNEIAEVSEASSEKELSLKLTTKEVSGRLTISPGKEIKFHLEPEKGNAAKYVSLVLPLPFETEFHLPEGYNLGRKIDSDMPVGEWYSTSHAEWYRKGLGYNFFLANVEGMWIRFKTEQLYNTYQRVRSSDVHISRHPEVFILTFTWKAADDAFIAVFSSMDEAIKDYEAWLEKFGIRKLREDPNLPEWVHNVKLILFVDMMRGNWEITHDYNDVINLAKDLNKIGCPKDTLFYIPGWNGAYDSSYPIYRPHSELGGEEKFREMMETLHKNGFRVMIHTGGATGLDPYHPNIDKLLKYVLRDEDGNYQGFQTGGKLFGQKFPLQRPLKFRSEKIPLNGPKGARSFTFETVYVPDTCEALITVGNLKVGEARVKFTIDRRSILTPPGWFKDHKEYATTFPFLLQPGINKVHVELIGEGEPDWSESWYKIRYCFIPLNPYISWTHPILRVNTKDPGWIKIYVDEVASAIRKYGIDVLYIDVAEYEWNKPFHKALKERLPDIPMATEGLGTLSALGHWTFSQSASQSLIGYLNVMHGTSQQASLPDRSKLEELYSWLNKPSPVSNFVKDYIYIFPHLCAADAFVPVGKVCNTFPPRLSPRSKEELWKFLRNARRLNYIPGLRLNYRKYGLDEETKKAIQEMASWK